MSDWDKGGAFDLTEAIEQAKTLANRQFAQMQNEATKPLYIDDAYLATLLDWLNKNSHIPEALSHYKYIEGVRNRRALDNAIIRNWKDLVTILSKLVSVGGGQKIAIAEAMTKAQVSNIMTKIVQILTETISDVTTLQKISLQLNQLKTKGQLSLIEMSGDNNE